MHRYKVTLVIAYIWGSPIIFLKYYLLVFIRKAEIEKDLPNAWNIRAGPGWNHELRIQCCPQHGGAQARVSLRAAAQAFLSWKLELAFEPVSMPFAPNNLQCTSAWVLIPWISSSSYLLGQYEFAMNIIIKEMKF